MSNKCINISHICMYSFNLLTLTTCINISHIRVHCIAYVFNSKFIANVVSVDRLKKFTHRLHGFHVMSVDRLKEYIQMCEILMHLLLMS